MTFLIASIISSTSIFIIFKVAERYSVRLLPLITLNYLVASLLGVVFLMQFNLNSFLQDNTWLVFGIILGILFIAMFGLIGISSQKSGITLTTLASKMSLVFPVLFSVYWFHEPVSFFKYLGILTAITAVLLSLYKKDISKINRLSFFLPLIIFIGGGFIDSLIKYVQAVRISESQTAAFTTSVFITAFLLGIFATIAKGKTDKLYSNKPTLIFGVLLGIANFGSLYFLINALNKSMLDSSLVFTMNHMLIVLLSALTGRYFFKERLNRINLVGFVLALLSLAILL